VNAVNLGSVKYFYAEDGDGDMECHVRVGEYEFTNVWFDDGDGPEFWSVHEGGMFPMSTQFGEN
jgi:hypothetical protein